MNALNLAKKAYSATSQTVRSPREIEYEVIARVTHALKASAEKKSTNYTRFAEAVHKNNQLWTTLATNVAGSDNELPPLDIFDVVESEGGKLWLGTINGLLHYDPQQNKIIARYNTDSRSGSKLSNNTVLDIHKDSDGLLWIATKGGGI